VKVLVSCIRPCLKTFDVSGSSSRDLSKLHTTYWKTVSCYIITTLLLGYIRFNLNLCSSFGAETCGQTHRISVHHSFTFCISQKECMQMTRV
jgi:hypothetical protein